MNQIFKADHTFAIMAYKQSPYLEECIKSVLAQTVPSRVFLSTATPNEEIESLAHRYSLPLHVNPAAPSIAGDWEFAAAHCETDYFTLAHQDDLYYPEYTASLLPHMKHSAIGYTNYEELTASGPRRKTRLLRTKRLLLWPHCFRRTLRGTFFKKAILRFGSAICCPSVLFNRAYCGELKFDPSYKSNLDWAKWLELAEKKGGFTYVKKVLMAHRIHEESETSVQLAKNGRQEEDFLMFSRLWPKPLARLIMRFYGASYDSNSDTETK